MGSLAASARSILFLIFWAEVKSCLSIFGVVMRVSPFAQQKDEKGEEDRDESPVH